MPSASSRLQILLQAKDETKAGIKSAENNLGSLDKTLEGLMKKAILAAGAIAAGFAARNVIDTTQRFGQAIQDMGRNFGLAGDEAGKMLYMGRVIGMESEEWTTSLKKLSTSAVDTFTNMTEKGEDTSSAFFRLGISVTDVNGQIKPVNALLGDVADKFSTMPDGTIKAAMAVDLFGKKGLNMIEYLNEGRGGIAAFGKEAEALGLTTGGLGNSAEEFGRAERKFGATLDAVKIGIGSQLLPLLTQGLQGLTRLAVGVLPIARAGLNGMGQALSYVIQRLKPLWDGLRVVWEVLKSINWAEVWAKIKEFAINTWSWIMDKAKPAMEALGKIWDEVYKGLSGADWNKLIEAAKNGDWAGVVSWIGDELGKLGEYIDRHATEWSRKVADGLWVMMSNAWVIWKGQVRPGIESISDWIAERLVNAIETKSPTSAALIAAPLAILLAQKAIPLVMANAGLILAIGALSAFVVTRLVEDWTTGNRDKFATDLATAMIDLLVFVLIWKVSGSPQLAAAVTILSDSIVRLMVGNWEGVTMQRVLSIGIGAGIGAAIGFVLGGPMGAVVGAAIGTMVGDMVDRIATAWQNGDIAKLGMAIGNFLVGALEAGINLMIDGAALLNPQLRALLEMFGISGGHITLPRFTGQSPNVGPKPIPMASGGAGIATRPTLFLAGERGPESFWFGGSGGRGGSPVNVNVYVTGNYIEDSRHINELAGKVSEKIMQRMRLQGQYAI